MTHWFSTLSSALEGCASVALGWNPLAANPGVQINGRTFGPVALAALQASLGVRIPQGSYWYDPRSGLWGSVGAGTQGRLMPWLPLGTPPEGCSGTGTGVFINGREVAHDELAWLVARVGIVPLGRYFLEGDGSAGPEGGAAVVNLFGTPRSGAADAQRAGTFYQEGPCGSVSGLYDPDGGSMVTVRDASGNATTWCP